MAKKPTAKIANTKAKSAGKAKPNFTDLHVTAGAAVVCDKSGILWHIDAISGTARPVTITK